MSDLSENYIFSLCEHEPRLRNALLKFIEALFPGCQHGVGERESLRRAVIFAHLSKRGALVVGHFRSGMQYAIGSFSWIFFNPHWETSLGLKLFYYNSTPRCTFYHHIWNIFRPPKMFFHWLFGRTIPTPYLTLGAALAFGSFIQFLYKKERHSVPC